MWWSSLLVANLRVTESQKTDPSQLSTPLWPLGAATSHTHTQTHKTQLHVKPFITAWTLVTAAAFLPCQSVRMCVYVWVCDLLPWPCAYVPLISQWRGGDILSDRPFKHTLPLHTGDFSPLQETSPKTNNSHASFLKRNNAGKERRTNPVKRAVSIRKTKIYQKNIHTRKYADIYIYLFFFGNVIQLDMHSFLCAARV